MPIIEVKNVSKEFLVNKRTKGFWNNIKSLIYREYEIKKAVENISFEIGQGELVGYIGPNGAGKSTTIKMLSGIIVPTSGEIYVNGRVPHESRVANAMDIGIIFGQRSQLYWDLPMLDTFDLYKKMYQVDDARFRRNVEFYIELLDLKEFLHRPVRQLSLGQKMRAELASILLHDPPILYLDEPTIGLDIMAKSNIRQFIKDINKEKKTTVILTTHDMDDIEQICNRIIMIDHGSKIYDGSLADFKKNLNRGYTISVEFQDADADIVDNRLKLISKETNKKTYLFDINVITVAQVIYLVTRDHYILDLKINEPEIEDIVKEIYSDGNVKAFSD